MTPGHILHLRHGTARLGVWTDEAGHRAWLAECLAPAVTCESGAVAPECLPVVEFRADAALFDSWKAMGPDAGGARVPAIDRDAGRVTWPRWAVPGAEPVAFDPEFEVFVQTGPSRILVLARDARPWTRVAWLRVVRQILMERTAEAGRVFVHAAAFEHAARAVLIAGPKRAGKTTLLVHALRGAGVRCIANDRVSVGLCEEGIDVRGMPTLVNVRPGTRAFFPGRFDGADDGPDTGCFTRAERAEGRSAPGRARPDHDVTLLPAHFAEAAGASLSIGGRLDAVIVPVHDAGVSGCRVAPLDAARARAAWQAATFGLSGRDDAPTWFGGRCAYRDGIDRAWAWLCEAKVPMLACRLGPDAYAEAPGRFHEALSAWMPP